MSTDSDRERWSRSFERLSADDRPLNKIANARKKNSAPAFDGKKIIENGKRNMEKRVKTVVAAMAMFTGKDASKKD